MKAEPLGGGTTVYTSQAHRFGTDAFLLTAFCQYREKDIAADLGTGCGIIPLLMQRCRPPARCYAVDIQENAIAQLRRGIAESGAEGKILPVQADFRERWEGAPIGECTLVVCNPPYQPEGSGRAPRDASQRIARHGVMCTPEDVCLAAARLLCTGGRFCVCGRPERLCDYICAARAANLEPKRLRFVAKTATDAPWLFLLEGRRGGKPYLHMEKPFIMYENGEMTSEAASLYRSGGGGTS